MKQLKNAASDDKLVEAVVRLRPEDPSQIVPPAERTEEITTNLLERVKKESGQAASRYNVFRNLGSFVVSAHPAFIEELIRQPEVVSIVANQQPGSAMIPPIKKTSGRNVSQRSTAVSPKGKRSRAVSKKSARKSAK
ncbi:MAG TPA: hypothetical protein VLB68_18095 [Pyrinomonadaceae bacterium]|nr:hypothetical protein [Pyrinomonadaceae bacterium]